MESSQNTFEYFTLDASGSEIRLLRLQPASTYDDEIHCELFHISLDDEPLLPYETVSYAWGKLDATRQSYVYLHSQLFNVTPNLEDALRCLRLTDKPRALWVDGLCINQQSLADRASQVAMMHFIYRRTSGGLFRLGKAANMTEPAFQFLKSIEEKAKGTSIPGFAKLVQDKLAQFESAEWAVVVGPISRFLREPPADRDPLPLKDVVTVLGLLDATDPRDFLYSVLGLIEFGNAVVPNYEIYQREAFCLSVGKILAESGSVGLLELSGFYSRRPSHKGLRLKVDGLPSWMPDMVTVRKMKTRDYFYSAGILSGTGLLDVAPIVYDSTNPSELRLSIEDFSLMKSFEGGELYFSFATTSKGYMAMVPDGTEVGDVIAVFHQGEVPFVLRQLAVDFDNSEAPSRKHYELIGPVYVHGFMDDLAMEWLKEGKLEENILTLV
ncbi:heterokaryon incompatibility protein-domain-containing protein [Leptodontidium sp. MPI-SDFR-AT-0119]|nr:heterokaryon incompatibility protein-domain-containing protein [Leptodontidium sp. MPI-SDFR-AT-0119]